MAIHPKTLWSLLAGLLILTGCKGPATPNTRLTIFAASSLIDVFQDMEARFEAENPGVDVIIATAGSQVLRFQIEQGAEVDIFASAHQEHMEALSAQGFIPDPQIIAHNHLVIVVPQDNPAELETVQDLPHAERIVLGNPEVPIGMYTKRFLELAHHQMRTHFRAEVVERIVSQESNVRQVLAKVELGEADAAIVYRTDASPKREVQVIDIPEELNPRADYHMGMLTESDQRVYAQKWLRFVASNHGKRVFLKHGFLVD